jgi:DnaJ-class molecular chaperone
MDVSTVPTCPACKAVMVFTPCRRCGGSGVLGSTQFRRINSEREPCPWCNGGGGEWHCPKAEQEKRAGRYIRKT